MPITFDEATLAVDSLAELIPDVPRTPLGRKLIIKELLVMVEDREKLDWLIESAMRSWRKFEGIRELRALYCHRYRPIDGHSVQGSDVYPQTGYSREQLGLPPRPAAALLPAPKNPEHTSLDPGLNQAVKRIAAARSMENLPELSPEERKRANEFEKVLREIETAPADRELSPIQRKAPKQSAIVPLNQDPEHEPLPEGSYRRITQADIDEAVRQLREKKGTE